jgi:hypothetical protein
MLLKYRWVVIWLITVEVITGLYEVAALFLGKDIPH